MSTLVDRVVRRFTAARALLPGEGDNVDKVADVSEMIRGHLGSVSAAVNDGDLIAAQAACRSIRDLAQTMEYMVREMDPENG